MATTEYEALSFFAWLTDNKFLGCFLGSFYQIGFPQPTFGKVRVVAPFTIGRR